VFLAAADARVASQDRMGSRGPNNNTHNSAPLPLPRLPLRRNLTNDLGGMTLRDFELALRKQVKTNWMVVEGAFSTPPYSSPSQFNTVTISLCLGLV
jgi:hypothetical protein